MNRVLLPLVLLGAILCAPPVGSAITIPTVPVGNLGNTADTEVMLADGTTGYGSVSHPYRIGTTEVTNAQYAAFLNEKAKSDPLTLYNTNMGSDGRGGITRSGVSGSFSYAPKANMADKPVNWVTWFDAIRFANWLNNGQGSGDTETGAYTILGGTATPANGDAIIRNPGATWFLTSEDEWYKAAYYDPRTTAEGGPPADRHYWSFATRSNSAPTLATANNVGDISNPGTNVANYQSSADWNGLDGTLTTVGSAGPSSQSYYGTLDQAGNVHEWNESLSFIVGRSYRGVRGGSFIDVANGLQSSHRGRVRPFDESVYFGFRVATVPEPSTGVMAAIGCCLLGLFRRRFKKP